LGRLLAQLRTEHPDIETELVHGVSGEILNSLRRGRIDAGFYLSSPDDLGQIGSRNEEPVHAIKLADFTYRVIAPAGWQKQVENADWASLAALPWIGTPETSVHHRLLASVFENLNCRPNVVALVDQEPSMLEMVRSGIGLSLCRDSIALHQKQTFGLAIADAVSVPACLCFIALDRHKDTPLLLEIFKLLDRSW
jgi:DNA-binding transcriptional LysR family regulator